MGLIPEDKIAEVRDRTDIVQVIGEHVALRRAGGSNWKGLCPFHEERTPSFNVNTARQIYHCFGCQQTGDVIRFKMELEKRDFIEVLRELAQRAGVELPAPPRSPEAARAAAERESERDRLLAANETACVFFESQLAAAGGERARAYLAGRGIGDEIRARFRIGYAPDGWDHLQSHFQAQKVPLAWAEKVGLVGTSERGRRYDFFRDRVMLPVLGRSGEVVGFGSRLLDPEAKERKYVNSPESSIYHKKDQLYGLHAARETLRKGGRAILVEGNFDVLGLHQAGFSEAVAPMGTALGADQVTLLRRFAKTVVLLFDGDAAGRKATLAAVELCARSGLEARVAALPDGVDPDDFVRQKGAEALRGLCDKAPPALEHALGEIADRAEATVPGRLAALAEGLPLLRALADPTARELYGRFFAERLRIEPRHVADTLRRGQVAAQLKNSMQQGSATASPVPAARRIAPEEVKLIALLLADPQLRGQADAFDAGTLFADQDLAQLYRMLTGQIDAAGRGDPRALLEAAPADLRGPLGAALALEEAATQQAAADCVMRMRLRRLSDEQTRLLREYEANPNPDLVRQLTEIARQRNALRAHKGEPG